MTLKRMAEWSPRSTRSSDACDWFSAHGVAMCALRHVVEERQRQQLTQLGVQTAPMLPFYSSVLVKVKRWHREGSIVSPFKSPRMSSGWTVQDEDGLVQQARVALLPDPVVGRIHYELSVEPDPDRPLRRLHRRQPLHPGPRLSPADSGEFGGPFDMFPLEDERPVLSSMQFAREGSPLLFWSLSLLQFWSLRAGGALRKTRPRLLKQSLKQR